MTSNQPSNNPIKKSVNTELKSDFRSGLKPKIRHDLDNLSLFTINSMRELIHNTINKANGHNYSNHKIIQNNEE